MSAASGKSSPRLASLLLVGSLIHSNRVQGLWLSGNRRLEPPRALLRSASAASASAAAAAVETTLLSDTTAPLPKLRPHEVRCGEQQWVDDLFHLRDPEVLRVRCQLKSLKQPNSQIANSSLWRCSKDALTMQLSVPGRTPPRLPTWKRAPGTPLPCTHGYAPSRPPFSPSSSPSARRHRMRRVYAQPRQQLPLRNCLLPLPMHRNCAGRSWGRGSGHATTRAASTPPFGGDHPATASAAAAAATTPGCARWTRTWCRCRAVPRTPAGSLSSARAAACPRLSPSPRKV